MTTLSLRNPILPPLYPKNPRKQKLRRRRNRPWMSLSTNLKTLIVRICSSRLSPNTKQLSMASIFLPIQRNPIRIALVRPSVHSAVLFRAIIK
ncbi:predicted protein [Nematostella vectensis]|uniref:Uncharacterized protein n=1 Tax=Nematostella vectensis TaxID=45351 RepID=A7SJN3_NEMVE|nr:predicted protein [Nematostella vectensis]|eukprot:XP_001628137.1 predicted protein [Nematostella vectensis]